LDDGFAPDTISSDLHRFNHEGPVFDLATTMSKYLHLGLPLADVVRMATTEPAAVIGRTGAFGTLAAGAEADIRWCDSMRGRVLTDSWATRSRAAAAGAGQTTGRAFGWWSERPSVADPGAAGDGVDPPARRAMCRAC
jgi:dihydroorotase